MSNFSIPTKVPFVPGYFYSNITYVEKQKNVQEIVNNGKYIGTELGNQKASKDQIYIYYIASLDSTPQVIDQYFIPESGHVYLLSSASATIGSSSVTSRSIPAGVIAYMKLAKDSNNNDIIIAQRINESDGTPAFCKSFGVGTVNTNITEAAQLDMRKFAVNEKGQPSSNSKWSGLIQRNDIWGDNNTEYKIYSEWDWSTSYGQGLIENFNTAKINYFYIWHLPRTAWDSWKNVSDDPNTTPEGQVAFRGSRYQVTQWKGKSLAGASVPVFQPFTIRQTIAASWLHDAIKNDNETYKKTRRHWQVPTNVTYNTAYNAPSSATIYREIKDENRYEYLKNSSGEYEYQQKNDGKYLLIEDDPTCKQPYSAYYLDLSKCTKYKKSGSSYSYIPNITIQSYNDGTATRTTYTAYSYIGRYDNLGSNDSVVGPVVAVKDDQGHIIRYDFMPCYVNLSIDIGTLQTWQNIAPLTIWWRYLIRQYTKSTLNGTAVKTKYKDDIGWANNYMDVSLQSRAYTASFRADGTSGLNDINSSQFNGKIYWALSNFFFSLITSSYTIQGSMTFRIGDYASGAGGGYHSDDTTESSTRIDAPYLALHEQHTDGGNLDGYHLLPNVRILSINVLMLSNSTREAYSVTYSGSGNPSVSSGISPAVAAPRVIQVMQSTGIPAAAPSMFNYNEDAGDQSVSAMYPSYADFCAAHDDITNWDDLGILNWDEEVAQWDESTTDAEKSIAFDHYCDAVTKVAEYYRAREEALYGYPNLPEDITEDSGLVE